MFDIAGDRRERLLADVAGVALLQALLRMSRRISGSYTARNSAQAASSRALPKRTRRLGLVSGDGSMRFSLLSLVPATRKPYTEFG